MLTYFGASLPNKIKNPLGSKLRFCDSTELAQLKITHDEYESFLNAIQEIPYVNEVMLISTCNRFEVICDLDDAYVTESNLNEIASKIAFETKSSFELACLIGEEAKRQILRTYCGLNSGLVGEDEICIQFNTAFGQGLGMGYLGKVGAELLQEAKALRTIFDEQIYPANISYCDVALRESFRQLEVKPQTLAKVVIFGSGNTAIKSAMSLVEQGVHVENITILHRVSCSSTQLNAIREQDELAGIKLERCKDGYFIPKTKVIIDGADLIIFGIDSKKPVLELPYKCPFAKELKGADLKVIDFNTKSSLVMQPGYRRSYYLDNLDLDSYVRAYADRQAQNNDFLIRIHRGEELIKNFVAGKTLIPC